MPPRFAYDRLSPDQWEMALEAIDMSARGFARLTGYNDRVVSKWLAGDEEAPHHATLILALLQLPGALDRARALADHMISADSKRPDAGPYPYRAGGRGNDE